MANRARPGINRRQVVAVLGGCLAVCSVSMAPVIAAYDVVPRTLGPSYRSEIPLDTSYPAGTILISTQARTLDLVVGGGRALRYRIGVGREGFGWTGRAAVGAMAEWPYWRPPAEMKARAPELPDVVPPGPLNPLGARAIYIHAGGRDTLYRIHGTNEPDSIGSATSSGCFRMTNTDVIDLFRRVRPGALIIVK